MFIYDKVNATLSNAFELFKFWRNKRISLCKKKFAQEVILYFRIICLFTIANTLHICLQLALLFYYVPRFFSQMQRELKNMHHFSIKIALTKTDSSNVFKNYKIVEGLMRAITRC